MSRPLRWVIAIVVGLAIAVPAGTYGYIHWFSDDAPERLALDTGATGGTSATTRPLQGGLDGQWQPTSESQVGYRVNEVLFGQRKEAVGRTSAVTGTMEIAGTTVSEVDLSADLTHMSSDEDRRDRQFHGRIMDTARFPTATFSLTEPIDLPSEDARTAAVDATGTFTIRGTTKAVTFPLRAQRAGGTIRVSGTIPVVFADYGIPNPSFGPVTTEDHGELEFLVVFTKGG